MTTWQIWCEIVKMTIRHTLDFDILNILIQKKPLYALFME